MVSKVAYLKFKIFIIVTSVICNAICKQILMNLNLLKHDNSTKNLMSFLLFFFPNRRFFLVLCLGDVNFGHLTTSAYNNIKKNNLLRKKF